MTYAAPWPEQSLPFERFLAATEEEPLDYTVVSVAVVTLGLLLGVEVIRHKLDQSAHNRPFFKTVLEGVYSECKRKQKKGRRSEEKTILPDNRLLTHSILYFCSLLIPTVQWPLWG